MNPMVIVNVILMSNLITVNEWTTVYALSIMTVIETHDFDPNIK